MRPASPLGSRKRLIVCPGTGAAGFLNQRPLACDASAGSRLRGPRTPFPSAHLVATLKGTTQATTNRRLLRLEQLGVIEREAGRTKAPGRKWNIVHPKPTSALLRAALALSEATAKDEARTRKNARRRLRRTRTTN